MQAHPILVLLVTVLDIYWWLIIASVVLSWLVAFNVVNTRNQFVANIAYFVDRVTDPVLRPIRNMLPSMGGIDVSPVVALLLVIFVRQMLIYYWPRGL